MSAVTDRLSDDDLRELAAIVRRIHARTEARRERERQQREAGVRDSDREAGAGGESDD